MKWCVSVHKFAHFYFILAIYQVDMPNYVVRSTSYVLLPESTGERYVDAEGNRLE